MTLALFFIAVIVLGLYTAPYWRIKVARDVPIDIEGNISVELEWIGTLNYTIDYGDKSCVENKNGNSHKETFVEILQAWKSISSQYNIPYFLVFGTLIGAVRNADFIPWDSDMDIMVDKDSYDIMACIDNKRNFNINTYDPKFHLLVQNDFKKEFEDSGKRRRWNCQGQVK